jgi:hypothetical protein
MEYRIVFDDSDDAKTLKSLLAQAEEIQAKGNWTNEDLKELDKLLAICNSISAKLAKEEKRSSPEGENLLASR